MITQRICIGAIMSNTQSASSSGAETSRELKIPGETSIHVRAFITWLAIFPLVALGMTVLTPLMIDSHPVLRSLVLTLIVVPLAVYIAVPLLLALHQRIRSKR
jgi:antibiotic biosynthesis monooxygenase (ABM) superfamily enzyme